MKLEFRKSFLDDLKRIRDREILQRLATLIKTLEQAGNLAEVAHVKEPLIKSPLPLGEG